MPRIPQGLHKAGATTFLLITGSEAMQCPGWQAGVGSPASLLLTMLL